MKMNAARNIENPIDDAPDDDIADRDRRVLLEIINELRADNAIVVANLTAENWRLIQKAAAERNALPELYLPLKAAAILVVGIREADYEKVRKWCELGKIVAEKRGGQWFVQMKSLRDYFATTQRKTDAV
jgi:hypothetical protein